MSKFLSIQVDQRTPDLAEVTIETLAADVFTFTATPDDVQSMIEALNVGFVEADEDEEVAATGATATNVDRPTGA